MKSLYERASKKRAMPSSISAVRKEGISSTAAPALRSACAAPSAAARTWGCTARPHFMSGRNPIRSPLASRRSSLSV